MLNAYYDLLNPSDTAVCPLGTEINVDGAVYAYAQAGAAITQYDFVQVLSTGVTTATNSATTTTVGAIPCLVGVSQIAVAINQYFWLAVGPFHLKQDGSKFYVNALASCAQDVKLYTSATAGAIDDSATTLISGLVGTTTIGGAPAAMECRAVRRLACNVS